MLVACPAPSHYLNQCWNIVNWTLRNKFQRNFNRYSYIFIQENAFENVVWKMVAILAPPQCVKTASRLVNSTNQGKSSCTCEAYKILSRIEKTPINLQFYPAEKVRRIKISNDYHWTSGCWWQTLFENALVFWSTYNSIFCSANFRSGIKSALVKPIARYCEGKRVIWTDDDQDL